jgi:uncharacterized membrane protein
LGSNANDKHIDRPSEDIDQQTLIQINGSMVVGGLFILTLTSLISGPATTTRFLAGYLTVVIVLPFILSALIILAQKELLKIAKIGTVLKIAKYFTGLGFIGFGLYLLLILFLPLIPTIPPLPFAQKVDLGYRTTGIATTPIVKAPTFVV